MKLDLHTHSYVSDGHLSPAAVVRAAAAGGLDAIALTDHDTAAGVLEAEEEARHRGVKLIPGIEISTRHEAAELHILGYFIDPAAEAILRHQHSSFEQRQLRMRRMVAKLQDLGVGIEFDEVVEAAGPDVSSIGRPHLARALLKAGHTRYYGEAFLRYLSDEGPAFVVTHFPPVREAIDLIHAAGGLAVWAHPPPEMLEPELNRFIGWGIDGIECYRPAQTPAQSHLLEATAKEFGLLCTGGSDWHGPQRAALGDFYIRSSEIRGFLEAGAHRNPGWSAGR
ncbi:MAG TPA: PHP domain-containing protein [Allosphingosinicella sp.]|nr:PHP domain-containing protein [Allosphingosinicella sp.]